MFSKIPLLDNQSGWGGGGNGVNMFIGMEHEKMNPLAFNFRRVLRSWLSRIPNWNKEAVDFLGCHCHAPLGMLFTESIKIEFTTFLHTDNGRHSR